ncbi:MAG: NTP transferase domain-containing protein [Halobacteriaceae archaeon]
MILGVLLAAGKGTRFDGDNKLLANIDETTVVRKAARKLCQSEVRTTIAVLGFQAKRVQEEIADLPLQVVTNSEYQKGQSTSMKHGVRYAKDTNAQSIMFALGDMPAIELSTYNRLIDIYRSDQPGIIVPTYNDTRGNPVIFDRRHFDELLQISGDTGGKPIFSSNPVTRVAVEDPGILHDVDTRRDLEEITQQ